MNVKILLHLKKNFSRDSFILYGFFRGKLEISTMYNMEDAEDFQFYTN